MGLVVAFPQMSSRIKNHIPVRVPDYYLGPVVDTRFSGIREVPLHRRSLNTVIPTRTGCEYLIDRRMPRRVRWQTVRVQPTAA